MASPADPIASSPREIRVFISSTFRDIDLELLPCRAVLQEERLTSP
jgi:hypothetical protein